MKCSIIIPAYNKADYTVEAVKSVLNQGEVECIVIDDGSTDHTHIKLFPYRDRITYIRQENKGASNARNRGIRMAKGKYIGFLDCDDKYMPFKIDLCIEKNRDFIHTSAHLSNGKIYRPRIRNLLWHNYICNSTVIVKKKCFDKVGLFDEDLFVGADWDMWLRMEEHYELTYLNIPLTYYRI